MLTASVRQVFLDVLCNIVARNASRYTGRFMKKTRTNSAIVFRCWFPAAKAYLDTEREQTVSCAGPTIIY